MAGKLVCWFCEEISRQHSSSLSLCQNISILDDFKFLKDFNFHYEGMDGKAILMSILIFIYQLPGRFIILCYLVIFQLYIKLQINVLLNCCPLILLRSRSVKALCFFSNWAIKTCNIADNTMLFQAISFAPKLDVHVSCKTGTVISMCS